MTYYRVAEDACEKQHENNDGPHGLVVCRETERNSSTFQKAIVSTYTTTVAKLNNIKKNNT